MSTRIDKQFDGMMCSMLLDRPHAPLREARVPIPFPGPYEVLLRISVCGVCRTDLHIVDGELPPHKQPIVPGHEAVGYVVHAGELVGAFSVGDRAGVPWLGNTCRHCTFCDTRHENLCDDARFTGYDLDGGYAEYMLADSRYIFHLPDRYDDVQAAPLLCAGLIGYRAYAMTGDARRIGLYGFGAAAHIIAQIAHHQGREIYAFTRPGDVRSQEFARSLGAVWSGDSNELAPVMLDAAILFAPAGALVPTALKAVRKGGIVVCAGIHMSDIPQFPYALLWGERTVRSVANLTRADGEAFFRVAADIPLHTATTVFPLREANRALDALRKGTFDGAAVLVNDP